MSKLECNIVQDLLPSFADSLVSEKTAIDMNNHLSACENCSKLYNEMIKGESFEQKEAEKEINYLKKIKKKHKRTILSILSAVAALVIILVGIYGFYGVNDEAYYISDIYVKDNMMNCEVNLFSSANKITKVYAEATDGIVTIRVRSSLFSIKKSGSKGFNFLADELISTVQTADGRVLWENGEEISQKINDIYNAKVKYIGDNSAVSNLLGAIDIHNALKCKNYSIHLLTDEKPYGLEIYDIDLYDEMFSAFTNESYEQIMKSCSFIILACIENCDYVQFDYIAPDGTENTYKLTVDEANDYLGIVGKDSSIKDWSKNHWELKILINMVGEQLFTSSKMEYTPYVIENEEIIDKITNNPIDKKYLDIQNNTPYFSVHDENENYIKWAEAYEQQYKMIYRAILDYAEKDSDLEDYIRKPLIEEIENVEKLSQYNSSIADLFYICSTAANGIGSVRERTYCLVYLDEARTKTLRLAELAYLLNIDFEWIE